MRPYRQTSAPNIREALYEKLGEKLSRALFEDIVRAKELKPKVTGEVILADVIAFAIYGIEVFFLMIGLVGVLLGIVTIPATGWVGCLPLALGVMFLGFAWYGRPRIGNLIAEVVPREQSPTLYVLADRIADELGARHVHGIVVGLGFNVAYAELGWMRRRILYIGLPLFSILEPRERVMLIAHELAHSVNSDPARDFVIRMAFNTLIQRYYILGIRFGINLLNRLLWNNSQRAEYLADHLAATISGTDAALSMLDKSHLSRAYENAAQHARLGRGQVDLYAELQREIDLMPARELERIRRVERLEGSRLDATHPPTLYRIELLKAHRVTNAKVVLSSAENDRIDHEHAPLRQPVQEYVIPLRRRRASVQNPESKTQNPT